MGQPSHDGQQDEQIIVLSAKSEERLKAYAQQMVEFLERATALSLADAHALSLPDAHASSLADAHAPSLPDTLPNSIALLVLIRTV